MRKSEAVKFFGTQWALARALGLTQSTVAEWAEEGIPGLRQLQIQYLTRGKLRASADVFCWGQRARRAREAAFEE
jgi:DNA-binding transcriptional regulator YdaS (Cro superfamily)